MKVIDIIEATQMRSVGDLETGKPKVADTRVPDAVAGGAVAVGAGSKADDALKRARKINRRFKGESVLKVAVKRVLPAIAKRQAGKAIPYVGLVAGLYFGANSLMKGDVLGAGLEVATSLPWVSLFGAVAGISIAVAREVYDEVYEDPADPTKFKALEDDLRDDPEGTWARIKEIAGYIKTDIEERLEDAKVELDNMARKQRVMKDVSAWNDEQRKSVRSADDIKWNPDQTKPATGNVPLARQAFNQRQKTGQLYK
jgi:hypothetical protein